MATNNPNRPFGIDLSRIQTYEIDLSKGILKADGPEDHALMMQALALLSKTQHQNTLSTPTPILENLPSAPVAERQQAGLTLKELLDKKLLLKPLKPASVLAIKEFVAEFEKFYKKKCFIFDIAQSDVTRYQEFLASEKKNVSRTIDTKVGHLKSLLNFALRQGYMSGSNPAAGKNLMTKRDKRANGWTIFEHQEMLRLLNSEYFHEQKKQDPDYYFVTLLAAVGGCRIGELTELSREQFQTTSAGTCFMAIRDSKTPKGIREVPFPAEIFEKFGLKEFLNGKTEAAFKYKPREGKGAGNAAGKKFSRHLEIAKITRDKLVFHSLRKFVNDYLVQNGVQLEPRCQFIGHETGLVNIEIYANRMSVDNLATIIIPHQHNILRAIVGLDVD